MTSPAFLERTIADSTLAEIVLSPLSRLIVLLSGKLTAVTAEMALSIAKMVVENCILKDELMMFCYLIVVKILV